MTLNSFCFVASWRQHTAYRRPTSWFDSDEPRRGLDILEQPSAIFEGEAGLSVGFYQADQNKQMGRSATGSKIVGLVRAEPKAFSPL